MDVKACLHVGLTQNVVVGPLYASQNKRASVKVRGYIN